MCLSSNEICDDHVINFLAVRLIIDLDAFASMSVLIWIFIFICLFYVLFMCTLCTIS